MKVLQIIDAARAVGVTLSIDGDSLLLRSGRRRPRRFSMPFSAQGRSDQLPASDRSGWSAQDWQVFFKDWAAAANSTAGFLDKRLRRALSEPALSNGSIATRSARRRNGAAGAMVESVKTTCSFRLGSSVQVMPGCTAAVGGRGMSIDKLRRSLFCQALGIAGSIEFPNDFAKNGGA